MYTGAIAWNSICADCLALLKVGWTLKLEFDGLIIMALWFDFKKLFSKLFPFFLLNPSSTLFPRYVDLKDLAIFKTVINLDLWETICKVRLRRKDSPAVQSNFAVFLLFVCTSLLTCASMH